MKRSQKLSAPANIVSAPLIEYKHELYTTTCHSHLGHNPKPAHRATGEIGFEEFPHLAASVWDLKLSFLWNGTSASALRNYPTSVTVKHYLNLSKNIQGMFSSNLVEILNCFQYDYFLNKS